MRYYFPVICKISNYELIIFNVLVRTDFTCEIDLIVVVQIRIQDDELHCRTLK